ncbi:MAG: hypothetical protein AAFV90_13265 [Cyanobacteria bacterium J06634_5]
MKKIIQKRCAVGAIAAACLFAVAGEAFAQAVPDDATINFTGTVGSVCTFSNVIDGVLGHDGNRVLNASLNSASNLGTPGSLDLNCTGLVEVSVSIPQENGSTTNLLSNADVARAAFGQTDGVLAFRDQNGGGNTSGIMAGPIDQTFSVGMFIEAEQPIPAGSYNYNVVVTATPQ